MATLLTRLGGFLVSISIDAIVAFDLITRPDKSPVTIIGDVISLDAVLFGVAVFATGAAVAFAWPPIVWVWTIPKRRAEQQRAEVERKQAEIERQRAEAEERESSLRNRVVGLLKLVRDQNDETANILHPQRGAQTMEAAAIAQERLQVMGLGLPKVMQEDSVNWTYHAARLIPHFVAGGNERATRVVNEWYRDEWEAEHSESDS